MVHKEFKINIDIINADRASLILENTSQEHAFYVSDNQVIRSLQQLSEALSSMSYETYMHHVNPERNDFVSWVRDVVGDEWLSGRLAKVKDKDRAHSTVVRRVPYLQEVVRRKGLHESL